MFVDATVDRVYSNSALVHTLFVGQLPMMDSANDRKWVKERAEVYDVAEF